MRAPFASIFGGEAAASRTGASWQAVAPSAVRRVRAGASCRSAFTLIETLVAVTVLSVGIVLVLQAMTHGMVALDAARDSLRAAWLCREGLAALHVEAQRAGGVEEKSDRGGFARPFGDYEWRLSVEPMWREAVVAGGVTSSNALMRAALDVGRKGATRHCTMGAYLLARKAR